MANKINNTPLINPREEQLTSSIGTSNTTVIFNQMMAEMDAYRANSKSSPLRDIILPVTSASSKTETDIRPNQMIIRPAMAAVSSITVTSTAISEELGLIQGANSVAAVTFEILRNDDFKGTITFLNEE